MLQHVRTTLDNITFVFLVDSFSFGNLLVVDPFYFLATFWNKNDTFEMWVLCFLILYLLWHFICMSLLLIVWKKNKWVKKRRKYEIQHSLLIFWAFKSPYYGRHETWVLLVSIIADGTSYRGNYIIVWSKWWRS